jgi:hypothetical protein
MPTTGFGQIWRRPQLSGTGRVKSANFDLTMSGEGNSAEGMDVSLPPSARERWR